MVEIYLLEQLTAFEKYGTLSRAAEELHITQPALSRSMKKLEEEFGVSLFDRSKSRIVLNETGKTAAEYAKRVLTADREMIERTVAFDRSRRTITLGACASLPARALLPELHEHFRGMAVTTEILDDERLIRGLRNHIYQLVILHGQPEDGADGTAGDIFWRSYMEERLSVTFPEEHPLASRKEITFRDLTGLSLLAHGGAGFWIDICRKNLSGAKLLIQDNMEMLSEIVDASTLPVFNSDRAVKDRDNADGRVTVPIADEAAHVTYYLACLSEEKRKYKAVFRDKSMGK